jgi:LCP family protein required for cell wall assembly
MFRGHLLIRLTALVALVVGSVVGAVLPAPAEVPTIVVEQVERRGWGPDRTDLLFVLVIGTDFRPGVGGHRADAIHLVGIDPVRKAGTVLNIPRDTYVDIPGHGANKINSANTFGGAPLMAATVAGLTGIQPHFVVSTDFAGFSGMVDELGGVTVDVPVRMADSGSGAFFEPGPFHMDGFAALAFSRNRYVAGGDFSRSANQARVILAGLAKLRSEGTNPASVVRYLGVLMRRGQVVGVGVPELFRLGRVALSIDPGAMRNITMPGAVGAAGAASVVHPAAPAAEIFADMADNATLENF